MKIAVKLTMDGLIKALRLKAHGLADTATLVRPASPRVRALRRKVKQEDKSHG